MACIDWPHNLYFIAIHGVVKPVQIMPTDSNGLEDCDSQLAPAG